MAMIPPTTAFHIARDFSMRDNQLWQNHAYAPIPRACIVRDGRCSDGGRAVTGQSRCRAHGGRAWGWSRPMAPGWPSSRAVHLRHEPHCRHCGAAATTVDHIKARAFGGSDEEANLQSLCKRHADEKNHLDRELGKKLKRERGR